MIFVVLSKDESPAGVKTRKPYMNRKSCETRPIDDSRSSGVSCDKEHKS